MVGVVVVHRHARGAPAELEPPPHPVEGGEPGKHALGVRAQLDPGEQCAERVERHVLARHGQP
jgi:hypothetical protein